MAVRTGGRGRAGALKSCFFLIFGLSHIELGRRSAAPTQPRENQQNSCGPKASRRRSMPILGAGRGGVVEQRRCKAAQLSQWRVRCPKRLPVSIAGGWHGFMAMVCGDPRAIFQRWARITATRRHRRSRPLRIRRPLHELFEALRVNIVGRGSVPLNLGGQNVSTEGF